MFGDEQSPDKLITDLVIVPVSASKPKTKAPKIVLEVRSTTAEFGTSTWFFNILKHAVIDRTLAIKKVVIATS